MRQFQWRAYVTGVIITSWRIQEHKNNRPIYIIPTTYNQHHFNNFDSSHLLQLWRVYEWATVVIITPWRIQVHKNSRTIYIIPTTYNQHHFNNFDSSHLLQFPSKCKRNEELLKSPSRNTMIRTCNYRWLRNNKELTFHISSFGNSFWFLMCGLDADVTQAVSKTT